MDSRIEKRIAELEQRHQALVQERQRLTLELAATEGAIIELRRLLEKGGESENQPG